MTLPSMTRRVSMFAVLGLLPGALAIGAERVSVRQLALEKEGAELINQLEDVARDIRHNADRLNLLARNPQTSKWTHYHHLEQIKSLVNEGLRPAANRLTEIQKELPSWHQHAIDEMLDSARALAGDTNSAFLRKASGAVPAAFDVEYKELIASIYKHADALVETSDAAGGYAAAHRKAVEAGLRVPTP